MESRRTGGRLRGAIGWAAVALGAVAGLLLMVVAGFLGSTLLWLGSRTGWESTETANWTVLSVALLAGELTAGYVAGRLGKPAASRFNGSLASLGLFTVFASLSLASGSPAGTLTLVIFAAVAAALGSWGGVLGARSTR